MVNEALNLCAVVHNHICSVVAYIPPTGGGGGVAVLLSVAVAVPGSEVPTEVVC